MERLTTLCIWYIAVGIVTTSLTSGELLSSNHEHGSRWRRAVSASPRQNCGSWSQWTNTHHPSISVTSDIEQVSKQDMDAFCPPWYGGNVSDIMCKDERGEPFQGNQTDNKSGHTISCENPNVGAVCHLLQHPTVEHCPDLSFQYFCSCSDKFVVTTTTPATIKTVQTTDATTLQATTENDQVRQRVMLEEVSGVDGLLIPWWILLLIISIVLFIISMCTTIGLYRHLKHKLIDKKLTQVNPLEHI